MENTKKPLNKKILIGVIVLVAAVALLLGLNHFTKAPTQAGSKTITVDVVLTDGSDTESTLHTDAEYLRGALEEAEMIEGTESEYGLFVTTVNGVTADESKQQWWCLTKDGEMLQTGVDSTPIADGDHFELTLTEGY